MLSFNFLKISQFPARKMKKAKILIADDEKDFCDLLKLNLESTGKFKVFTALDGKSCLKLVQKKHPNAIVLDIKMPDMDGFEVLKNLKQDQTAYEIPVIMLSALADQNCIEEACGWFAVDYLTKPARLKDIVNSLERALYF